MTNQTDKPADTQDLYFRFANSPFGKKATRNLGLPSPIPLKRRQRADEPFLKGNALIGAGPKAKAVARLGAILQNSRANLFHATGPDTLSESVKTGDRSRPLAITSDINPELSALVFDATGLASPDDLRALYDFFHPTIRKLATNGRILVIGQPPITCRKPARAAAQQALEGFVRSLGKEVGHKGATANLVWLAPNAESQLDSTVRFFLSTASAYISGQTVRIGKAEEAEAADSEAPLNRKVALVTGASRGIGAAIARTLARDGATVIGLDMASARQELQQVTDSIGGKALTCDITQEEAPGIIAEFIEKETSGVDFMIHNAGITRDKTLGKMPEHFWDTTIAVNLLAEERIDEVLLSRNLLRDNGRIVCVSSISGIAGNFGQTNYAAAKSGVIGYVEAMARQLKNGITINAVAPGFIESQMTAAMPFTARQAGRRMNSLAQGGQPVDVAEAIVWYCHPASAGVNGNVVRVCGQSIIGR